MTEQLVKTGDMEKLAAIAGGLALIRYGVTIKQIPCQYHVLCYGHLVGYGGIGVPIYSSSDKKLSAMT